MMAKIAVATENSLDYAKLLNQQQDLPYLTRSRMLYHVRLSCQPSTSMPRPY